jgi:hypothetical protein
MPFFKRSLLHPVLNRAVKKLTKDKTLPEEKREEIKRLLDHKQGMAELAAKVDELAAEENADHLKTSNGTIKTGAFIDWISSHMDQIMAFIQMILKMFGI